MPKVPLWQNDSTLILEYFTIHGISFLLVPTGGGKDSMLGLPDTPREDGFGIHYVLDPDALANPKFFMTVLMGHYVHKQDCTLFSGVWLVQHGSEPAQRGILIEHIPFLSHVPAACTHGGIYYGEQEV